MTSPSPTSSYAPPGAPPGAPSDLAERVERLERRADAAPAPSVKKKDPWDVVQILGGALIPVAIAAGGWFYSQATSRAQIENARQIHERDAEIAVAESRVKQAELVKDFLEALTGRDVAKQRVAIQAVLIALPEDGPRLVRELSVSTDSGVATFAGAALSDRCQALVERLFAADRDTRVNASQQLLDGWRDSPALLDKLLPYARRHLDDADGVYNSLGVLAQITPGLIARRRADVEAFVAEAERAPAAGDRIRALAAEVRARIRAAA